MTVVCLLETTPNMIRWFFNIWARFRPYCTEWVEDLPDELQKNAVYVIGGRKHPFYAAIVCPRKACRQVVHVDVSPQVKKRWRITEHMDGKISLWPSVHVTGLPCGCHYWFRKGRIVWSESPPLFVPEGNKHDP